MWKGHGKDNPKRQHLGPPPSPVLYGVRPQDTVWFKGSRVSKRGARLRGGTHTAKPKRAGGSALGYGQSREGRALRREMVSKAPPE